MDETMMGWKLIAYGYGLLHGPTWAIKILEVGVLIRYDPPSGTSDARQSVLILVPGDLELLPLRGQESVTDHVLHEIMKKPPFPGKTP